MASQSKDNLVKQLKLLNIGVVENTTTLEKLKKGELKYTPYETRSDVLYDLTNNDLKVQAYASDAIILRTLLEEGHNGSEPYKNQGYVIAPPTEQLIDQNEEYAIVIYKNTPYSGALLNVINQVLKQPSLLEERKKLEQYESGQGDGNVFSKNLVLGIVIVLAAIAALLVFLTRNTRLSKKSTEVCHKVQEAEIRGGSRTVNTGGGDYYESIETSGGYYIQGNYISMSQDLAHAAGQIQDLIEQLQNKGASFDVAKEQVVQDMGTQAQNNPVLKDKLVRWGQSLGDATVNDVVKGVVKLAIRNAGIPLP